VNEIGCIGLGLLGSALSERLTAAGWTVRGFDIEAERRSEHASRGGISVESACAAAESDVLLLSLPTSDIVESVLGGLAGSLTHGQTIIDTTTGAPETVERLGRRLAERGIDYLDATVGGSSEQARHGDAIIMCGGESSPFERNRELFDALAKQTFYLGPSGSGSRMKLVLNLVLGLNRAVLGEGLAFARACGIDESVALDILRAGPSWSKVMDTKGEKMLTGDFEPQARLAQHLKDVRLILEAGRQSNAMLPLSKLHEQLLDELVQAGYGDLDNSAVIRAFKPSDV
jgi:3-hydroxyisobutyrate dehydrogenase-like beta-hydroxyacid dehydrogenase